MRAAAAFEKAHPTGLELPNLIQRGTEETTIIPDTAVVLADIIPEGARGGYDS
jgi:hypothetical protein